MKTITAKFEPNQTSTEVTMPIQDDNDLELLEMFSVTLVIPRRMRSIGVVEGAVSTTLVSIIDDDSKFTICTTTEHLVCLLYQLQKWNSLPRCLTSVKIMSTNLLYSQSIE